MLSNNEITNLLTDKQGWKVRPCAVNNTGGQSAYLWRQNPYEEGYIIISEWKVYTSQKEDIFSEEVLSLECDMLLGEYQEAWNLYEELTSDFFED